MDCPRCGGVEMNELSLADETVFWRCEDCFSLWIDSIDLSRLLVHNNLPGIESLEARENLEEAVGRCPDDLTDLVVVESLRNDSLSFAICEVCGGIWLPSNLAGEEFKAESPEEICKEILELFSAFGCQRRVRP